MYHVTVIMISIYYPGNENIHYISRQKSYKLMVELGDWEGRSANAIYDSFKIENEQGFYRLHLGKFVTGAARDGLRFHENIAHGGSVNGMAFSTRDRDHDKSSRNCAKLYNGGWWYNDCFWSNLNGDYVYKGGVFSDKFTWFPWKMNHYSLKTSKMKLKPTWNMPNQIHKLGKTWEIIAAYFSSQTLFSNSLMSLFMWSWPELRSSLLCPIELQKSMYVCTLSLDAFLNEYHFYIFMCVIYLD